MFLSLYKGEKGKKTLQQLFTTTEQTKTTTCISPCITITVGAVIRQLL